MKIHNGLLIAFLAFVSSHAWSATGVVGYNKPAPRVLWRWTKSSVYQSDSAPTREFLKTNRFPFPVLPPPPRRLSQYFPSLVGKPALFTWSHPVTGMGANPNEMYGDIPIRLEILSDARTMELRSEINYIQGANGKRQPVPFAGEMDLTGIDIIEHHVFSGENELFREWVILNPDVILTVMTDPGILKPILMEEFAKLRNENFRFTDFELHTFFGAVPEEGAKVPFLNDLRYRNHFASVIERYLESTPELDPVWKNWKNRNACLSRLKPATPKRNINFAP